MTLMVGSVISPVNILHHHVYDKSSQSWTQRAAKKKPFVRVRVKVDREACQILGAKNINTRTKEITDSSMADTRASVCLSGTKFMRSLGLSESDLTKCDMRLYGADNGDINPNWKDLDFQIPVQNKSAQVHQWRIVQFM